MDFLKGLYGLSEGKFEIDPVGEAQSHDVCIVLLIMEGSCPRRKLIQVHIEEINRKFPIEIAEFVFPIVCVGKTFREFFQISLVIGAVIIDAFMNTEVFSAFYRLEGMSAVRAL